MSLAYFYEIRSSYNAFLKRDGATAYGKVIYFCSFGMKKNVVPFFRGLRRLSHGCGLFMHVRFPDYQVLYGVFSNGDT